MKSKIIKILTIICAVIMSFSLVACGESAYEIAVKNGFKGSEQEWVESLKGTPGRDGERGEPAPPNTITLEEMYRTACENGFVGTFDQFLKEYLNNNVEENNKELATSNALLSAVDIKAYFGRGAALGAGVIYKLDKEQGDAYIITNFHVVYDSDAGRTAQKIELTMYGCTNCMEAEFVGGSSGYDIAVLKVTNNEHLKNSEARAVKVGDSDHLKVGSTAIAVGNPDGGGIAATNGVVSVDSEYIPILSIIDGSKINLFRSIRVDTAINHGNSGGGLYNSNGELIGIVNAKTEKSGVDNIGYAIPSSIAIGVADNIIWNNKTAGNKFVSKGLIGVTVGTIDSKAVYNEELQMTEIVETVIVDEISRNSLSDGHLKHGDVIKKIGIVTKDGQYIKEKVVTRKFMVVDFMLNVRPHDVVRIEIQRQNKAGTYEDMQFDFKMESKYFQKMI